MTLAAALEVAIHNLSLSFDASDENVEAYETLRRWTPFIQASVDYNELTLLAFLNGEEPNTLHAMAHVAMRENYHAAIAGEGKSA